MKYFFLAILASIGIDSFAQQISTASELVKMTDNSCDSWLFMQSRGSFFEFGDLDIPGNKITVEAMINRTSPYSGGSLYAGDIVSKHEGPSNANYLLRPNHAEITTSNGYFRTPDICEFELNKTYHVAFVYDGSLLKFYRNGFLMSQVAASGNLIQNNYKSVIGYYDPQIHNTQFLGYINNVRIWNVARTQQEIRDFMNLPIPNPETATGLRAYFDFSSLENLQGNNTFNGRLTGTAQINRTNPACSDYVADSCCVESAGFLTGSNACEGILPLLTFRGLNGHGPYTLVYSDGQKNYTQTEVYNNIPFEVKEMPVQNHTPYRLISIQHDINCPPTLTPDAEPAYVYKTTCLPCTGTLGEPLFAVTFGAGTNPGSRLEDVVERSGSSYEFIEVDGNPAVPAPMPGQYTITNNVPLNSTWFSGQGDHAPDNDGRMAFFNLDSNPKELMNIEMQIPCAAAKYEISAWVANVVDPAKQSGAEPDLLILIETIDGVFIAAYETGLISQTSDLTWKKYAFYFTTAYDQDFLSIKIIDRSLNNNNTRNAIAIDDIIVRQCGPIVEASFVDDQLKNEELICAGNGVTLFGKIDEDIENQNFSWEYSDDSINWTRMNNTGSKHHYVPSEVVESVKYYRVGFSISMSRCITYSNIIQLNIMPKPSAVIKGDTVCAGESGKIFISTANDHLPLLFKYLNGADTLSLQLTDDYNEISLPPSVLQNTLNLKVISLSDANGCEAGGFLNPVSIVVNDLPQGGIEGQGFCVGEPVFLTYENADISTSQSIRLSDGVNIYNFENVSHGEKINFPALNSATEIHYNLLEITESSKTGCKRTENFDAPRATVTISPNPELEFNAINPVCSSNDPILISNAREVSGLNGTWEYSGNGINSSGLFQPGIAGGGIHGLIYKFKSDKGCTDSVSTNITVINSPVAYAGMDRFVCQDTINLHAMGGTSFEWLPALNLSNPNIANPVVTLNGNIEYIVKVGNGTECYSYDTVKISRPSNNLSYFKLPTAFTPNGDGKNDCFGIQHWGNVMVKEFSIFNRWGEKIFSSRNSSSCWDGSYRGRKQDAGGYVYIISADSPCGEIIRKGIVMLIN